MTASRGGEGGRAPLPRYQHGETKKGNQRDNSGSFPPGGMMHRARILGSMAEHSNGARLFHRGDACTSTMARERKMSSALQGQWQAAGIEKGHRKPWEERPTHCVGRDVRHGSHGIPLCLGRFHPREAVNLAIITHTENRSRCCFRNAAVHTLSFSPPTRYTQILPAYLSREGRGERASGSPRCRWGRTPRARAGPPC